MVVNFAFHDFALKLLLGTILGAVIGSERERAHRQHTAGIRTFSLIALLGTLCGILALSAVPLAELFPLAGLAAIITYTYLLHKTVKMKVGMTTLIALPLVFMAGLLVGIGLYTEAVVSIFIMLGVLYVGQSLHERIENLKPEHVNEIVQFSLIFFVLYPLLPKEPVEIAGIMIDFTYLFFLVLLVSLLNLAVFLINRFSKGKATLRSGFLCGVINSTAAIYFFSKKSKESGRNYVGGATAAVLGSVTRNAFLTAILLTDVFLNSLLFFAVLIALLLVFLLLERKGMSLKFPIEQPFNIVNGTAIVVALFAGIVLFQIVSQRFPLALVPASFLGSTMSTTFVLIALSTSAYIAPIAALKSAIIAAIAGSLIVDIVTAAVHRADGFFKSLTAQLILLLAVSVVFLMFPFL